MTAPLENTTARFWWNQGAAAEVAARSEGLSSAGREICEIMDALARRNPGHTMEELAGALAYICCPYRLKRRYRRGHGT